MHARACCSYSNCTRSIILNTQTCNCISCSQICANHTLFTLRLPSEYVSKSCLSRIFPEKNFNLTNHHHQRIHCITKYFRTMLYVTLHLIIYVVLKDHKSVWKNREKRINNIIVRVREQLTVSLAKREIFKQNNNSTMMLSN